MVAGMYTLKCDCSLTHVIQKHASEFPILARITLDYLPSQASSIPCERLFSASKQTAVDRRARLTSEKFEHLQVLKFAWRKDIPDFAALNDEVEENIDLALFDDLHQGDMAEAKLDDEFGTVEGASAEDDSDHFIDDTY